ncbi:MAG: transglutaminase domain-containing protein [Dehalococcoidales bacterium]|nr:transglutaminase domain-containing protein [Dehalococcoidales bacterium]
MNRSFELDEGWLSFVLLTGMVLSAVWSVVAASWVDGLDVLPWIAIIALAWGLVLAKLPLPGFLLHLLALGSGSGVVVYFVDLTLSQGAFEDRFWQMVSRLLNWISVTTSGGIGTDNLLFLLLLASITWLIGYFGAWTVFHSHSGWWVSFITGTALVLNLSYAPHLAGYFIVFLICAILLVVRLNIYAQEKLWRRVGVRYSSDLRWGLLRTSFLIATLVVLGTWLLPNPLFANDQVTEMFARAGRPWDDAQAEFNRLFGGVRPKDQPTSSGFGRTLPLKSRVKLGGDVILQVSGTEPRRLRGIAYQRFTGMGWLSADGPIYRVAADGDLPGHGLDYKLREDMTQTITVIQPRGTVVFAASAPKRVNIPATAETASPPSSPQDYDPEHADVSAIRSPSMARKGLRYAAVSSVSTADAQSLRKASGDYPDWVRKSYLALPRTVTPRTVALARQITDKYQNAYDKAVALETYLRSLAYSDQVALPPSARDAVDYFLFEAKQGYCDYFASAFVVMARSRGIPARVVAGFAPGDVDSAQGITLVRDWHAHSWPEVYFPQYGWIEFEPTPSRPTVSRPETPVDPNTATSKTKTGEPDEIDGANQDHSGTDLSLPFTIPDSDSLTSGFDRTVSSLLKALMWIALTAGVAYLLVSYFWRNGIGGLTASETAYAKMRRLSSWIGIRQRLSQTPNECAVILTSFASDQEHSIRTIVDAYVRQTFGRKRITSREEEELSKAWRQVRNSLLRSRLSRLWPGHRFPSSPGR